jgi:hypothetical protein
MLLNNLYLQEEAYCECSEIEIMFVRKQRVDIAVLLLVITLFFELTFLSEFAPWKLPFGFVLLLPLSLYVSYNRRLTIDKETGMVYNQNYLFNFLYKSTRVIQLKKNETLYVGCVTIDPDNANRTRYTLYAKRKKIIHMFEFSDFDTVHLLENVLHENFTIDIVYCSLAETY